MSQPKDVPEIVSDEAIDKIAAVFDPNNTGRQYSQREARALMYTVRDMYEAHLEVERTRKKPKKKVTP